MSLNSSSPLSCNRNDPIIIWARYFYPGYKAGGPIISLSNLCSLLAGNSNVYVITQARDSGDTSIFPGIIPDSLNYTPIAPTIYIASLVGLIRSLALIATSRNSTFYLNSVFSFPFSILPLLLARLRLFPVRRVILCPRGELFKPALQGSLFRKRLYLKIAQFLDLHRGIHWHATSAQEAEHIHTVFRTTPGSVSVIRNIPSYIPADLSIAKGKQAFRTSSSRLVFASRILPHKNLLIVLEALSFISSPVVFDIYGPIEDQAYYQRCLDVSNRLPSNIIAAFHGAFLPQHIKAIFTEATLLVHPSLSENYCHTIIQALAYYTPTVIGTNTPWSHSSSDAITTCNPLDSREWSDSIQKIIGLSEYKYFSMTCKARSFYDSHILSLSSQQRDYLSMLLLDN